MNDPIREAAEQLLQQLNLRRSDPDAPLQLERAEADLRAAMAAAPPEAAGEGEVAGVLAALESMAKDAAAASCDRDADQLTRAAALIHQQAATIAALQQPAPGEGEGLPAGYIDPEHTGEDRELLDVFYRACQAEGGTTDEITLRGIRAAIAAALQQPEPGEGPDQVREALRKLCDAILNQFFGNDTELPKELIQATNEAQMILARHQHYPVRLAINPPPELIEELNMQPGVVKRLPIDKPFAPGEGELTDKELDDIADETPLHGSPRQFWRNVARAAIAADRQRRVVPVAVSERLPEPGDWVLHCYAGVRFWQFGIYNGRRFFVWDGPESQRATHWLPFDALPQPPQGEEVQ